MNKIQTRNENDSANIDISVDLCGVRLSNPLLLASGILGSSGEMLKRVAEAGAGAVVTKTTTIDERFGHPNPSAIEPMKNVILNAMGQPNPGCQEFAREIPVAKLGGVPVIGSIAGNTPDEFAEAASIMDRAGVDMIEINPSCPHPKRTSGERVIGQDPALTCEVLVAVRRKVAKPLIVKLSPNVTDIREFVRVAVECRMDAISAINTVQALEVEPFLERPVLGNGFCGQSGPSIKYIALRKVADIALCLEGMKEKGELQKEMPIIGIGGVRYAEDVVRFMLVGAKCVQVGSSILYDDLKIFSRITSGLEKHMKAKGYSALEDFRGNALKWLRH